MHQPGTVVTIGYQTDILLNLRFRDGRRRCDRRGCRPRGAGGGDRAGGGRQAGVVVDQEREQSLGGQAFWSLGGLFLVDSPNSGACASAIATIFAWQDWLGSGRFRPRRGPLAAPLGGGLRRFRGGREAGLAARHGPSFFPVVGWAERGGGNALAHGNSVPRFHMTWGTGPGVVAPFVRRAREANSAAPSVPLPPSRRRTDHDERRGRRRKRRLLEPSIARGEASSRNPVGQFACMRGRHRRLGGIGGNHDSCARTGLRGLGNRRARMVCGVPAHVDGRMLAITEAAGGRLINRDRMWHYVEGVQNWRADLARPRHPNSARPFLAMARRTARACRCRSIPGYDTLGTLGASAHGVTIIPGS